MKPKLNTYSEPGNCANLLLPPVLLSCINSESHFTYLLLSLYLRGGATLGTLSVYDYFLLQFHVRWRQHSCLSFGCGRHERLRHVCCSVGYTSCEDKSSMNTCPVFVRLLLLNPVLKANSCIQSVVVGASVSWVKDIVKN
jgi:hypothetical protein